MAGTVARELSDRPIPWEAFDRLRRDNLARWPTGAAVDIDEAVAFHQSLPERKRLSPVLRAAAAEGRCLTQPRGGFATFEMQLELLRTLEEDGLADVLPTSTDSYTRNERFEQAAAGSAESRQSGRSMLNGFPIVYLGLAACRRLIQAVERPVIVLSGTALPRLTAEIALAAGYTGFLGSGIAYTASYTKTQSIEDGIRNYQYLDRLTALYGERGVRLHRRQPGFLTGTTVPPSLAIAIAALDALLAAASASLSRSSSSSGDDSPQRRGLAKRSLQCLSELLSSPGGRARLLGGDAEGVGARAQVRAVAAAALAAASKEVPGGTGGGGGAAAAEHAAKILRLLDAAGETVVMEDDEDDEDDDVDGMAE